ncbi:MAG: ABC transporter ATP-binding protein [Spirochaetales bacterium]|nr:ABC transporter ATP-binding protein [Spirochaetales bacterium]
MVPFGGMFQASRMTREGNAVNPKRDDFVLKDVNLTIPDGKVMVILGPSGCGKSTLLRLIAGLIPVDSGHICYDGKDMGTIKTSERKIGMVFQNYALYPHFTAKTNVLSYFLFKKKTPELDQIAREKFQKTSELLGVDIKYLMNKQPATLSGGEKQRVAIGRCITRDPALFLLDEPFSNLDAKLREKYRYQLKKLLRHFQITTVYVTHDQQEALCFADELVIMNIGSIEQVGTPEEIYKFPSTLFVAEFLNPVPETPAINTLESEMFPGAGEGKLIGVRPEDMALAGDSSQVLMISGVITEVRHLPIQRATILCVSAGEHDIYAHLPLDEGIVENKTVTLYFTKYHVFDKESGKRIRSFSGIHNSILKQ